MERRRLKQTRHALVLATWIVLLCAAPCPAGAPLKAVPPASYSIQKIEVTESAGGPRVIIEGTQPFEYTVFKLSHPLRLVLELPGAQLGKLAGPIQVKDGVIGEIRSRQSENPKKPGARVEIGLSRPVEYNVTSEANRLLVDLALPPATGGKETELAPGKVLPKAKAVQDVGILARPDSVEVDLKGDGLLPDYRSFQLARPPRLVIDLPRLANQTAKKNIDVGSRLLKEIRLGQHPGSLRFVFIFPENRIPPYHLFKEGSMLKLFLGRAGEEALKKGQPRPAQVQSAAPLALEEAQPEIKRVAAAPPPAPQTAPPPAPPAPAVTPEAQTAPPGPLSPKARMSLDFKDADLHNIFRLIAEVSDRNIIIGDDVKGKITIRLVNVPWEQALDVILATKNLVKVEEGNVIRITTLENMRKEMDEKAKEQEDAAKVVEAREKSEELYTMTFRLNYAKALEFMKALLGAPVPGVPAAQRKPLLGPRGSVIADERTNTLVVRDTRQRIEEVQELVRKLDTPTPQVLIEARIVQAQTTFVRSLGIQWGGSMNQTGGGKWSWGLTGNDPNAVPGWGFPTNMFLPSNFIVNFPASTQNTPVGGAAISFGKLTQNLVNLDLRLQLGETDSQVRVIARPKLATLDYQEAIIKQGEKIPYETTSAAGTQVQFIDAVLSLKVTPHVTPDNSISMDVKITRDARGTFRSPINQVPSIDNREASTKVLVRDGETLVIGGIYESENAQTEQGIPWLMKIPILGWLFKNQEVRSTRNELLIFITPTILVQAKVES